MIETHGILALLHPLKKSMKMYNFFVILYSNSGDTAISNYGQLNDLSINKLTFFIDDNDRIELAKEVITGNFDFISDTIKYKFISDTELFDNTILKNDTNYYLYISKLIKWALIPHNNLLSLNNNFSFNRIALCYTSDLVTNTISLPKNGLIITIEELAPTISKTFDVYDNSIVNLIIKLTQRDER